MSVPLLRLHDVSKTYSGDVPALSSTTLELGNGIFGLLGPNGAGKTTLLRLLATLLKPSTGSIEFDGCDSLRDRTRYRANLGYLPQRFGLYPNVTALEHLLYFASLKGIKGKAAKAEANRLLEEMGLSQVPDRNVGMLSGGMKQRVGIAGALMGSPRLLVVDEPTAGLDPEERIRFRAILEKLSQKAVVILSTHIIQDIELGCSRVAVVADGRILSDTTPQDLTTYARGKTWELEAPSSMVDELEYTHRVTSVRYGSDDTVRVRFVGEEAGLGEVAVDPQIDDAYLLLMKNYGWSR